jgi:hypothetical protein
MGRVEPLHPTSQKRDVGHPIIFVRCESLVEICAEDVRKKNSRFPSAMTERNARARANAKSFEADEENWYCRRGWKFWARILSPSD